MCVLSCACHRKEWPRAIAAAVVDQVETKWAAVLAELQEREATGQPLEPPTAAEYRPVFLPPGKEEDEEAWCEATDKETWGPKLSWVANEQADPYSLWKTLCRIHGRPDGLSNPDAAQMDTS